VCGPFVAPDDCWRPDELGEPAGRRPSAPDCLRPADCLRARLGPPAGLLGPSRRANELHTGAQNYINGLLDNLRAWWPPPHCLRPPLSCALGMLKTRSDLLRLAQTRLDFSRCPALPDFLDPKKSKKSAPSQPEGGSVRPRLAPAQLLAHTTARGPPSSAPTK